MEPESYTRELARFRQKLDGLEQVCAQLDKRREELLVKDVAGFFHEQRFRYKGNRFLAYVAEIREDLRRYETIRHPPTAERYLSDAAEKAMALSKAIQTYDSLEHQRTVSKEAMRRFFTRREQAFDTDVRPSLARIRLLAGQRRQVTERAADLSERLFAAGPGERARLREELLAARQALAELEKEITQLNEYVERVGRERG